jgi:hypothetical protein
MCQDEGLEGEIAKYREKGNSYKGYRSSHTRLCDDVFKIPKKHL